jgi:dienelactone hydrolase
MTTVVLFHSVLGLRPAIQETAEVLRTAGHEVQVPDLYDGKVFDDMDDALRLYEEIGPSELIARTEAAVAGLPADLVYMGFSNGGVSAEYLTVTRPGARGTVLMHAALPIAKLGLPEWPAGVPVQIHYSRNDPWRSADGTDLVRESVEAAGGEFTLFEYPVDGHLFTDAEQPEFDQESSELAHQRILEFLTRVG